MPEVYKDRRVIWESKAKQLRVIGVCFLFVAAAIWTNEPYTSFGFWFCIAFFGGGGGFMLYQLLSPSNLFVTPTNKLGREIRKVPDEELMQQITYCDGGFLLTDNPDLPLKAYAWKDLEVAFGYKVDCYTTDEICLDFFGKTEVH